MKKEKAVLKVLRTYKISPEHVYKVKPGVYRVVARKRKQMCVKRMGLSARRITWIDDTLHYIVENGCKQVCWRNEAIGDPVFVRAGRTRSPYVVTPWLTGRHPLSTSKKDMRACAYTLARFHKAARSDQIPQKGAKNVLGKWPAMLGAYRKFIKRQVMISKKRQKTKWDRLLRSHRHWLLNRVANAISILKRTEYDKLCQEAAKQTPVCHADSGSKNFVITKRGPVLIDFETLRIDLQVYDLYRLIRLAGKKNGWDFSVAREILDSYQKIIPLSPEEIELIVVWLQFPCKAYKIMKRYAKATPAVKKKLERQFEGMIQNEQDVPVFCEHLQKYAHERS